MAVSVTLITLILPGSVSIKGKVGSFNVESASRIGSLILLLFVDPEWMKENLSKAGKTMAAYMYEIKTEAE